MGAEEKERRGGKYLRSGTDKYVFRILVSTNVGVRKLGGDKKMEYSQQDKRTYLNKAEVTARETVSQTSSW